MSVRRPSPTSRTMSTELRRELHDNEAFGKCADNGGMALETPKNWSRVKRTNEQTHHRWKQETGVPMPWD